MNDRFGNDYYDGASQIEAFIESDDSEAPMDWLMGAASGAATGAALGPYGALAGAAIGAGAAAAPDIARAVQGGNRSRRPGARPRGNQPAAPAQRAAPRVAASAPQRDGASSNCNCGGTEAQIRRLTALVEALLRTSRQQVVGEPPPSESYDDRDLASEVYGESENYGEDYYESEADDDVIPVIQSQMIPASAA